ncbi:MAG: hypothetical protein P8Y45_23440, partial [Exilibacterium sp.]
NLKTHTVMVIIDQFSRRIIGFSVFAGDPFGADACRMYNFTRGHHSLEQMTPSQVSDPVTTPTSVAILSNYRWQSHCKGLFSTPVAV